MRALKLGNDPLCEYCDELGIVSQAFVVDHIERVRNRPDLAFSYDNLASCCYSCHNSFKQSFERTGIIRGCDEHGIPKDKNHHWN